MVLMIFSKSLLSYPESDSSPKKLGATILFLSAKSFKCSKLISEIEIEFPAGIIELVGLDRDPEVEADRADRVDFIAAGLPLTLKHPCPVGSP